MSQRDDERFHVRPGAPKARSPKFINHMLAEIGKAGTSAARTATPRPGPRSGAATPRHD